MTKRFFSNVVNGRERKWYTESLWELAKELMPFDFAVEEFDFNQDVWFHDVHTPTVELVLDHMKRVQEADLQFPIILNKDGVIMDGVHRLCKARLNGLKTVKAVQFLNDPEPDEIL